MEDSPVHFTPRIIIKIILASIFESRLALRREKFKIPQIFPPLPTADQVVDLLSALEHYSAVCKTNSPKDSFRHQIDCFVFQNFEDICIDYSFQCLFQGDLRPIVSFLESPLLELPLELRYIVRSQLTGSIKRRRGRRIQRDKWKYMFSRYWLLIVEEEPKKLSADRRIELFFNIPEFSVPGKIRELKGTDDERRIVDLVKFAKANPGSREEILNFYCGKFRELFSPG